MKVDCKDDGPEHRHRLTEDQIIEYFKKSYTAVDGLWFMKVEEIYGFDPALDLDEAVWKILSKIQARMMRSMLREEDGTDSLYRCLSTKLWLEGFEFEAFEDGRDLRLTIQRCPWHDLMVKSDRKELSRIVGHRICDAEFSVWSKEFGDRAVPHHIRRICDGADRCIIELKAIPEKAGLNRPERKEI